MRKIIFLSICCAVSLCTGAQNGKRQIPNESGIEDGDGFPEMKIMELFDGGICPSYQIEGNLIIFDLIGNTRTKGDHINVLIDNVPGKLRISIVPSANSLKHWKNQGLFISQDGETYIQKQFDFADSSKMEFQVEAQGRIWIASTLPYGRNRLDLLYSDTHNSKSLSTYLLKKDNRIVPVFQFGEDEGEKTVHYIIAGECAWETAGQWVADYMIRELSKNTTLREKITSNSIIRIIPHLSPYSATTSYSSYAQIDGEKIYGAATWANEHPPTEYLLVREEIEDLINEHRLGFMLTIHSWYSQSNYSGIETIRSSGDNRLEGERYEWAKHVLTEISNEVPRLQWSMPEKIWYEGLARDYLLKKYNAITFRIEITTNNINHNFLEMNSKTILENLTRIKNWNYVLE